LSFIGSRSARSSAAFRSGAIGFGLRLRPFGLPLCPGLNRYSLGGWPGPTLYSGSDVLVGARAASGRRLLFLFFLRSDMLLIFSFWHQAAALARRSAVASKVSPELARIAALPV